MFEGLEVLKLSHCVDLDDTCLEAIATVLPYCSLSKLHLNSSGVSRLEAGKFEQKNPKVNTIF